jgi:hypothetical protein
MFFSHSEVLESFSTTPPSQLVPINGYINKRKSRQPRQSLSALRCTQDNTAQHYCNRRARAHQPQHARCRTGAERIPCAFLFLRCGTIFQNWMPVNRPRTYKCTHKCTHQCTHTMHAQMHAKCAWEHFCFTASPTPLGGYGGAVVDVHVCGVCVPRFFLPSLARIHLRGARLQVTCFPETC